MTDSVPILLSGVAVLTLMLLIVANLALPSA